MGSIIRIRAFLAVAAFSLSAFSLGALAQAPPTSATLLHNLPTNTTLPIPPLSCMYVDQGPGTDTKLCPPSFAAAFGASPTVANTTMLREAATTTYPTGVTRLTDGVAGAPILFFTVGSGACSIDDGASCVNSSNGNSWIGQLGRIADFREWSPSCTGASGPDITTLLNEALASGSLRIAVPSQCHILGNVLIPSHVSLEAAHPWAGGLQTSPAATNYLTSADLFEGPSATIEPSGPSASMRGLNLVADNLVTPTSLRSLLTAVNAFSGTAITCAYADFHVENVLVIGFNKPFFGTDTNTSGGIQCDRPVITNFSGDNTNGIWFDQTHGGTASADVPKINNVHLWPFLSYTTAYAGNQTVAITGVANNGSGLVRLTFAAPSTAFVTGDSVTVDQVGGATEADGRWIVTAVGSTQIDLQGSTFSSAWTSGGNIYLDGLWRHGNAFYEDNANTGFLLSSYFVYDYNQGWVQETGGGPINCDMCASDNWNAGADTAKNELVLAGSAGGSQFSNSDILSNGNGVVINSPDFAHVTITLTGSSIAGGTNIIDNLQGSANITGGSMFAFQYTNDAVPGINLGASSGPTCVMNSLFGHNQAPLYTGSPYGFTRNGCGVNSPLRSNVPPATGWQYNGAGAVVTVANGASYAFTPGSGLIIADDQGGNGDVGVYACGGNACTLISSTEGTWVAPTITPAGGTKSIDGTAGHYTVFNNSGATTQFSFITLAARDAN